MNRTLAILALVSLILLPATAAAHHGVASIGVAGPEGPGAALETSSALTLPRHTLFLMLRDEYASFAKYDTAEPENKEYSSFYSLAVGFGITPWLSLYVFQPYNIKHQDSLGTTSAFGDTNIMATIGLKCDEGLKLLPEKESIDELSDWHFAVTISSTLPLGRTNLITRTGDNWAPDMQGGFGSPSLGGGVAVTRMLPLNLTWLGELSMQYFFEHDYGFTRYQFGTEARLNNAIAWKAYGRGVFRADLVAEINFLNLMRDRERTASDEMEGLDASGGLVMYGVAGARLYGDRLSGAVGVKRALASSLNEGADQQGAEGLETFRVMATLGATFGL